MNAHILFRTNDILVTPSVARFGAVSYQVATISSVAVYHKPKLNPIAVTLVLVAAGLAALAYLVREQEPEYSWWGAIAAPIALILGVAWQRFRPVLEYQFLMKTAGNETETIATFDREHVFALREAIESAFLMQRPDMDPPSEMEERRTGRISPRVADERPEDGLHITRDWVVANVDLAPR